MDDSDDEDLVVAGAQVAEGCGRSGCSGTRATVRAAGQDQAFEVLLGGSNSVTVAGAPDHERPGNEIRRTRCGAIKRLDKNGDGDVDLNELAPS